jgi:hypothetical protein
MGVDLCDLDDIISEGLIEGTTLNETIANKISTLSDDIRFDTDDETLTSANRNAKRACIFGVLAWLEKQKMITSSRQTVLEREGNTEIQYNTGATETTQYRKSLSYIDEYYKYLYRLMPYTPVGSTLRRCGGY